MHRLVPEIIIEGYRRGEFRGHLKAAGMFLDISGFSAMTDALMQHGQHGAEVLAAMMRTVFDPIVHSIFAHNGMIAGFAGDAITALFPAGGDETLAARQALAAAWDIQTALKAVPVRQTFYGEFPVSAKIGLAFGDAHWGILASRSGDRASYYFRGTAVDHSARAEHHARAGETVLDPQIFPFVGELLDTEPRSDHFLVCSVSGSLPAKQVFTPKPVDTEIARRFFLDQIILEDLPGEFRHAVNLFIRFPDLPEETFTGFMYDLFDLQVRYGGLISRIDFGDKGCNMIILWGAPVAYENDIGRALNFILDLQARVAFPLNAGVTYYISRAGYIGSELFEDFTCYGWGINLAARFMMNAPDGEVWIDERIARRVSRRFETEFVGEQRFKGFTQSQRVYALRGRKTEAVSAYQGRLIGRKAEMETLSRFLSPLLQNQPAGVLTIKGDAGIGKSRLVYEFRNSEIFQSNAIQWAMCQSDQILRRSLNPFRYWFRRYFSFSSDQSEESNKTAFDATLQKLIDSVPDRELAAELHRTRSVLGALLDLHWPDSLYERLDARGRYETSQLALVRLLQAESLLKPIVIFIEDIQYLDDDSREFLPLLKRSITAGENPYPIGLILTTRRQGTAIQADASFEDAVIELGGLSLDEMAELSANILGARADNELLDWVIQRAEGNPYFAEQILRYLLDEKLIVLEENLWTLAATWEESTLPADISAVLIARLDQLALQVKNVIQTASVLGREFEVHVLAKMLREGALLSAEVSEAEEAAIWLPLSQIRYIFTHGLLRDAAYTMQMVARRQELHTLAVSAYEELFREDLQPHYGELAYHCEQAALTGKAIDYLALAGKSARRAYQNTESLDYYERAIALLPANDVHRHLNYQLECIEILSDLGRREEQLKRIEQADLLAVESGDEANVLSVALRRSKYYGTIGNFSVEADLAGQAIAISEKLGRPELALDAHLNMADAMFRMSRFEDAVTRCDAGLQIARQYGDTYYEAHILNLKSMVLFNLKSFSEGMRALERSLECHRANKDLRGASMVLTNLGTAQGMLGNTGSALSYFEQALAFAREVGSRKGEGVQYDSLGWIYAMRGDYRKAREYSERGLVIAREIGDRQSETNILINLSGHACAMGDVSIGITSAEKALAYSRQSGDRHSEAWALTYLGHNLLVTGDYPRAEDVYASASEIRRELKQPNLETEPCAGAARASLMMSDLSRSGGYIEKILSYLDNGGNLAGTDDPIRVYANCYLGLKQMGDSRAETILEKAYEALNQRAASIDDPAARQKFFVEIPINLEVLQAWEQSRRP